MFKLPEDLESKYAFISLASARAEQLQTGAVPRVESPSRKITLKIRLIRMAAVN